MIRMIWSAIALLMPLLAFAAPRAVAQETKKSDKKIIGTIQRLDPRFDELVPKGAQLEQITQGYIWTEGPVWYKPGKCLLFSDIPNNVIVKWQPGAGASVFLKPSGYTGSRPRGGKAGDEPGSNGLMLDNQQQLVLCEHGDRRVTRIEKDGSKTVLCDNYMGKRLNSPNDLTIHPNGDIYFTDPSYGLAKWAKRELSFEGVFRIRAKDGKVSLVAKDLQRANGIALSPDAKKLYVTSGDCWVVFPVHDDGSTGPHKMFVDIKTWPKPIPPGGPDGLKVDSKGNIFATGPGGVCVMTPDGTLLGRFLTGDRTANVCFGDADGQTMYVCINHRVGRIRLTTKGLGW